VKGVPLVRPSERFGGGVVVLSPHMDDEALACGRTLASLPDKERIHVAFATDGSRSPVRPFGPDAAAPALRSIRRAEAVDAMQVLGIPRPNLHFWDLTDGRLARYRDQLDRRLSELIEETRPRYVFAPFRFDRHPDHLVLNRAATRLAGQKAEKLELLEYFVYYRWALLPGKDLRRLIRPDLLIMVNAGGTGAPKRAALECYRSQTTRFYPWQSRAILPPERIAEVSEEPEYFLPWDPRLPGAEVFPRWRRWIQLVHATEPLLKEQKERVRFVLGALRRRDSGIRSTDSDAPGRIGKD
jgi:LmbE family N-acetylglucosaminyl deacetylase